MKISLVFPQWTHKLGNYSTVAHQASMFPPLNLAILASIALKAGHEVQLIDAEAEQLNSIQLLEKVYKFKPDLIGMTATTSFFDIVTQQAMDFKRVLGSKIVIGGVHVTHFKESIFYKCFDYFIIGQCENTFASFLKDPAKTKGVIYRDKGHPVFTGYNDFPVDLDNIPFPAIHLLNTNIYTIGTLGGRKVYTSMMLSRGCPYHCVFCSSKIFGTHVRRRSVLNAIEELRIIVDVLKIKHIYFVDDTFTLNREYILHFCDEIQKNSLKFTFETSTRANLVDEKLIQTMKKAGLIRLSFGLESADLRVRELIRKEIPLEAYIEANRLTNKYGIETINSVMLGLPGDTKESIYRTIDWVRYNKHIKHATFAIAIPYPGSVMWEWANQGKHGLKLLTKDFSKYQRYGSAVMEVNGMSPSEILNLQKYGLMRIYSVWWRIIPVIKRFGIRNLIVPFLTSLWSIIKKGGKNEKNI
uniref:Putative radical SAM superfamily protein n=1 Tax=viral metagenome TaxID=1070528 RepID=A0A6M3L8A5_9ZZZZ